MGTSSSYDGSGNPVYSTVDPVALTTAVQSYLQTNEASGGAGPFMIPGELANVPAINAYTYHAYSVDNSGTKHDVYARNDLMRDVVGALTTQSNVYSIWVVTQTIAKSPANTDMGLTRLAIPSPAKCVATISSSDTSTPAKMEFRVMPTIRAMMVP